MELRKLFLLLLFSEVFAPADASVWSRIKWMPNDSLRPENANVHFLSSRYHAGWVLQTNDFLRGENMNGEPITSFHSLAFCYGVQTAGQKAWHHVLNFPYYGVSFYNANFFDARELGYPTALFGFLGIPLMRTERSSLGYELGFGLTYNWKPYDPYKNPFNLAIGSHHTVYIDASLYYSYDLSKRWQLKSGFSFTHFSNGATKKPNSGLNLVSPFVELNYALQDRPLLVRQMPPPNEKHYELALQLGAGKKQETYKNPDDDELRTIGSFSVINISAALLRQPGWKHKFGAGVDATYDTQGNLKVDYDTADGLPVLYKSTKATDRMKMGIYGTYEFCIDRLSIASCLGLYALRNKYDEEPPVLYQKFGLKYHLKNDMYFGLMVRARKFTVADVIEWNVGYRLKWN